MSPGQWSKGKPRQTKHFADTGAVFPNNTLSWDGMYLLTNIPLFHAFVAFHRTTPCQRCVAVVLLLDNYMSFSGNWGINPLDWRRKPSFLGSWNDHLTPGKKKQIYISSSDRFPLNQQGKIKRILKQMEAIGVPFRLAWWSEIKGFNWHTSHSALGHLYKRCNQTVLLENGGLTNPNP